MFWVALAALIMVLSGTGDDTAEVRRHFDNLSENVEQEVQEPVRREHALAIVEQGRSAFTSHRERLALSGQCIERLDRRYAVTREQYRMCLADQPHVWDEFVTNYGALNREFSTTLTAEELARLRAKAKP